MENKYSHRYGGTGTLLVGMNNGADAIEKSSGVPQK